MSDILPEDTELQKSYNMRTKPNYRSIANRLVGCRGMDDESFFQEIIGELKAADMNGRLEAYAITDEIKLEGINA